MDSPMRRYMLAAGLSCRAREGDGQIQILGRREGQRLHTVAAVRPGLAGHSPKPVPGYVLGIDAYLTDGGWKPETRIPEPAGTRRGD